MGFNPVVDAQRRAAMKKRIVETGLRVFSERTIDAVNLTDIAAEAGVAMTSVYRYFNSKEELVLEIGARMWDGFTDAEFKMPEWQGKTAAAEYEYFLDAFIDLYRNHRDILRFNQYFNIFVKREGIPPEKMRPYNGVVETLSKAFHGVYERACVDGTLRTDVSEREMFSATLHLMLAVVTRYAIGLVYDGGVPPEQELLLQKEMLLNTFAKKP